MAWVTPAEFRAAWIGDDAPKHDETIQIWLDRAERMIRRRVPDLETRIGEEPEVNQDLLDTARDVVITMTTRVFRNPEGIRQNNMTTGPYTESRTYGGDVPGELILTENELADLREVETGGKAFTIDTTPAGAGEVHPAWWLEYGGTW
jgi:hypothetical protein